MQAIVCAKTVIYPLKREKLIYFGGAHKKTFPIVADTTRPHQRFKCCPPNPSHHSTHVPIVRGKSIVNIQHPIVAERSNQ
jgi:hypothetical protein